MPQIYTILITANRFLRMHKLYIYIYIYRSITTCIILLFYWLNYSSMTMTRKGIIIYKRDKCYYHEIKIFTNSLFVVTSYICTFIHCVGFVKYKNTSLITKLYLTISKWILNCIVCLADIVLMVNVCSVSVMIEIHCTRQTEKLIRTSTWCGVVLVAYTLVRM